VRGVWADIEEMGPVERRRIRPGEQCLGRSGGAAHSG
jgi:hypothetical protein